MWTVHTEGLGHSPKCLFGTGITNYRTGTRYGMTLNLILCERGILTKKVFEITPIIIP
jgi:hypothetical protein